jgi:hypothetical protein
MTQLATREQGGNGHGAAVARRAEAPTIFDLEQVWQMAEGLANSKLFPGIDTAQKAFTLMMLCQADGIHPMQVVRRYDIIQGRPAMKSAAIQAEFQARGGRITPLELTDKVARARFVHPQLLPEGFEFSFTWEQAAKAGLANKDPWKQNPSGRSTPGSSPASCRARRRPTSSPRHLHRSRAA